MSRNIRINLMYDGTAYHGFQRQKNGITIQECLETAIKKLTGEEVNLIGCGRTDAGVHAINYTANFLSETKVPAERLPLALNAYLPPDIRVFSAEDVPLDFHARFSAVGKTYIYRIVTGNVYNVFLKNYSWFYPGKLDFEEMKKAALPFWGTHDFKAFMATGSPRKSTVRTVKELKVTKKSEDEIEIEITADGFLYNMVRIIAGTLLYAGCGKIKADDIPSIIESGERVRAGITAPPEGLALKQTYYE
ncbi:MAG: tRNA pseudouridine(38-40) synthase TruA [Clostridia bacterium]|nr:tRNA pseudouridine(38-40) synthase TruA [Clostridia bacterium]